MFDLESTVLNNGILSSADELCAPPTAHDPCVLVSQVFLKPNQKNELGKEKMAITHVLILVLSISILHTANCQNKTSIIPSTCQATLLNKLWSVCRDPATRNASADDALESFYRGINDAIVSCDSAAPAFRVSTEYDWHQSGPGQVMTCLLCHAHLFPCIHSNAMQHASCISLQSATCS